MVLGGGTKINDDDQKICSRIFFYSKMIFWGINFLVILDNFCSEDKAACSLLNELFKIFL